MDSNVRGLDIPQAFDTYVEGPSPRQRQHREDELGRLLRWATIAPPFGAGNDSIQASEEILFGEQFPIAASNLSRGTAFSHAL